MVCTASERDGTGLLLVATREISLAGMEPSKQAAPQQLPGERGLGCPPLCCLPASKLNGCIESPGQLGGPGEELSDLFGQATFRGRPWHRQASSQKQIN